MKLKEILDKTTTFFKDKKIESPRLEAELLLSHGLKLERIQLYLRFDQPMKEEELVVLRELVKRRVQGEPMAYILGYRDFYKSRFLVNPSVLIPRPETEALVEEAVLWARSQKPNLGIIDLGSGSGCVGLSLLLELPQAKLVTVDVSAEALQVAKQNAEDLGVLDRVCFLHLDAGSTVSILEAYRELTGFEQIDILVSNPPYISEDDVLVEVNVKKFEPHLALYAKDQGLELLKSWSQNFAPHLRTPGIMLMEMGMGQGSAMRNHFEGLGRFESVEVLKDLAAQDRIIRGVING